MLFYARIMRPHGISEAIIEEYKGLPEMLRNFRSISVKQDGMSDVLSTEATSIEEATQTFERLKHLYDVYAKFNKMNIELLVEPLF